MQRRCGYVGGLERERKDVLKEALECEELALQRLVRAIQAHILHLQIAHSVGALFELDAIFGARLAHRLVVLLALAPILAAAGCGGNARRAGRRRRRRLVVDVDGLHRLLDEERVLHLKQRAPDRLQLHSCLSL